MSKDCIKQRIQNAMKDQINSQYLLSDALDRIEELETRNVELESTPYIEVRGCANDGLDAARYRWLKANCHQSLEDSEVPQLVHTVLWEPNWREMLDEAIDAEIRTGG